MDTFSRFTISAVTSAQTAKTVTNTLVNSLFYTYGIPAGTHSDKGRSFDNSIIVQLYELFGHEKSTTMPYNHHGNSLYKRFIRTVHDLLETLPQSQKPNWPSLIDTLVFACNVIPHSTTEYKPYQHMFGCKAPTPCDNCWGWPSMISGSVSQSFCIRE